MKKTILASAIVSIAAFGLAGCDVKKTQEGSVTVPKYDVQKTQEGQVTLPRYDVKGPDVQVGSTEKQVTVPTVSTEKRDINVPTLSVKTAKEKEQEEAAKTSGAPPAK